MYFMRINLGEQAYIRSLSERDRLRHIWLHHRQQLSEFYIHGQNYNATIGIGENLGLIYPEKEVILR